MENIPHKSHTRQIYGKLEKKTRDFQMTTIQRPRFLTLVLPRAVIHAKYARYSLDEMK